MAADLFPVVRCHACNRTFQSPAARADHACPSLPRFQVPVPR